MFYTSLSELNDLSVLNPFIYLNVFTPGWISELMRRYNQKLER